MKRNEIVQKLMNEGFSESTLVNMSDKQLNMLSERILSEETVMVSKKSPTYAADIEAAKKSLKTIETYEGELKGDQDKLDKNHNGEIDAEDFKLLKKDKKVVNKEKKEINEWVKLLANENFHSFTSKNEIMEMINTKLNEQGPAIAEPDIDVEPDIKQPSISPDKDPFIDPWDNPNEGPDPDPKFEKGDSELPDFMRFKEIINSFN
jgi:hypothetical protein